MSRIEDRTAPHAGGAHGMSDAILHGEHAVVDAVVASGPGPGRQRWWLEIPLAVAFYWVYAGIRDLHGAATTHAAQVARAHGYAILHAEQALGLDIERGLQTVVMHARPFVVAMDVFYGTGHFLCTAGVFFWLLFRGSPQTYRRARNVLAIGTAIALVGFALYATMPPRLMPPSVKTIDTLAVVGGLWSYNHGVLEHISDPYAAMPSLHVVWSSWVAYALTLRMQASRWRWLFWLYPVFTSFVIIATGTHWVLDLAGGAVVFAIAVWAAKRVDRLSLRIRRRHDRQLAVARN
jgi:membrane-associated phospholipid phosphatase